MLTLEKALALPDAQTKEQTAHADKYFDPWALFPELYGSYSSQFDELAINVLEDLQTSAAALSSKELGAWSKACGYRRRDLASEIFREMLCTKDFCDYGTSPRVCFATGKFAEVLPQLIEKWKAYYKATWDEDYVRNVGKEA